MPLAVAVVVNPGQLQSWSGETFFFKLTFVSNPISPLLRDMQQPLTFTEHLRLAHELAFLLLHGSGFCGADFYHVVSNCDTLQKPHQISELFHIHRFLFPLKKKKKKDTHFIRLEWEDKSLIAWFGVGLVEEVDAFLQLAQVEHVVKAGVCVGDDVEDDVPVVLEGVHVMVDDHCPRVVLGLHFFAGLSVNQVDQSLTRESAN